jgi:adenosyl cobinamide kinase/adenosyl cobinamide phosphate guanylyltransferase
MTRKSGMELIVVTGGVRSGKSRWVQNAAYRIAGSDVSVIATAEIVDEEMASRIRLHQAHRPDGWETIEAPRDAGSAILQARHDTVILDCLTVLAGSAVGRVVLDNEQDALAAIDREVEGITKARASRQGRLFVVTNEVGLGVHPATPLGRWYQDGLGAANQRLAAVADSVLMMVSGLELRLK